MTRLCIAVFCLMACAYSATPLPTATPLPPTPEPGWQVIAPGLELRSDGPAGSPLGGLAVLRIDPNQYVFRVHYSPQQPQRLTDWELTLPDALAITNAGFFTPEHLAIGLLVSDGIASGTAIQAYGGSFVVRAGQPRILSNVFEPDLGDQLEQAVQAYPLLVYSGQRLYETSTREEVTRRTVVAQDGQGRILLMATPLLGLSLDSLAQFLVDSDLGIVDALNLDGGGSTMLYVDRPGNPLRLASLDPVPAVVAVYLR